VVDSNLIEATEVVEACWFATHEGLYLEGVRFTLDAGARVRAPCAARNCLAARRTLQRVFLLSKLLILSGVIFEYGGPTAELTSQRILLPRLHTLASLHVASSSCELLHQPWHVPCGTLCATHTFAERQCLSERLISWGRSSLPAKSTVRKRSGAVDLETGTAYMKQRKEC